MATNPEPNENAPRTLSTETFVRCPICGRTGKLVLRRRANRWYAYVYHGHEKGRKIEHYIGPCPELGTDEFQVWLRSIEEKRAVKVWLPASLYDRLVEEAVKAGKTVDEYIVEVVEIGLQARAKAERERKMEEAMKRVLEGKGVAKNQATPQPARPSRKIGRGGSGITSWLR